jgi:hypothetical protein
VAAKWLHSLPQIFLRLRDIPPGLDLIEATDAGWAAAGGDEFCRGRRYHRVRMLEILLGAIGLIGVAVALLWLIGLPGEDNEEELAGFVTANWDEINDRVDNH